MTVETEFLHFSAEKLVQSMDRIETCVAGLKDDQVWSRLSDNQNSIANLLLHLHGNVRQWIAAGVAGVPYARHRDQEFAARSGDSAAQLTANLRAAVSDAVYTILSLPAPRLLERVQIQGYEVTMLTAIYHVVEHFVGHTFQIILSTKRFTGNALGFYDQLNRGGSASGSSIP